MLALGRSGSHDLGEGSLDSRSLCYSLRSDEKSRSWHHGLVGSDHASEVKIDGEEALHFAYLYYFLRSDAKTGFRRCWLSAALPLMVLALAGCTLGASAIP